MEGTPAGSAAKAVALLGAAVDALLGAELSCLPALELTSTLAAIEVQRNRLDAVDARLLGEIDSRGVATEMCAASTAALVSDVLRLPPTEAAARVHAARDLGPRRELSGAPLPPAFGRVAEALASGAISAAHAAVIRRCVAGLPFEAERVHGAGVEALLVDQAHFLDARQLIQAAQRISERLGFGSGRRRRDELDRRRSLHLTALPDGSGVLDARLTAEATAAWKTIIDALSAPTPSDGEPDDRTPAQRRHDALFDAGLRLLRSGDLPDSGGLPVTILATVSADDLKAGTGWARTAHGNDLPVETLLSLATDAGLVPVLLSDSSGVLSYGRCRRLASPGQRYALAARDGGCSFPGCDRPASWCQVHHVRPWLDGGETNVDQLTLVCGFHHREFERRGWAVRMSSGRPHWIPPPHVDPDQRPRRNRVHHLPELIPG